MVGKDRSKTQIFCIGDKGVSAMTRPFPDLLKYSINEVSLPINYPTAMAIATHINIAGQEADKIVIFFNEFKSAISTIIRTMELLP